MLVNERERTGYSDYNDYDAFASDHYARYDYDRRYEEDRNRTSLSYRESLRSDLERPATRSRLERSDADRYSFYMANSVGGESNYDRFWDSKLRKESEKPVASPRKKLAFIITYVAIALVAVIAVTLSVLGLSSQQTEEKKLPVIEPVSASAEVAEDSAVESEAPVVEEKVEIGGENYVMLKSGEVIAIELPERKEVTKEEEKGFDKVCSWLNGVFGG